MQRPRMGHSKGSESTSSVTPRPVSKGRSARNLQPTTSPSAYSFDDPTIDPFLPSTPPTFTASMQPTFFKSPGATSTATNKSSRNSNDSTGNTPKQTRGFDPKPVDKGTETKPQTHNGRSPSPPVAKPFNTSTASYRGTRSRDASISSLPVPNHDDMILPAVARRLKEQGELYDHDVIAYSDDYHAPLYKLPAGSPGTKGNPFASYDKAKAASTSNLQQRSPSGSWNSRNPEPEPPMPATAPTSLLNQPSAAETNGSDKNANGVSCAQGTNPRNSSDMPATGTVPSPMSSPPPSQRGVRPERPQRARRNTQPENMSPRSTAEYDRNGSRRPTRAEAEAYSKMSNQDQQYQQQQQLYQQESSHQNSRQSPRQNNGSDRQLQQQQQHVQTNNQYQDQYTGRVQGSNYGAQEADRHDTRQQQQGQDQRYQQQQQQKSGDDQRYNYSDPSNHRAPRDANFSPRDNLYPAQQQYQHQQHQQQQQQQQHQQRPNAMTTIEMSEVSSPIKDEQEVERMDAAQVPKKKGTVCCVVM